AEDGIRDLIVTGVQTCALPISDVGIDLATFANGAAFRYYDLNDSYVGGLAGHPSDHIAACLAVAESERSSAAELITAIVLAYERSEERRVGKESRSRWVCDR